MSKKNNNRNDKMLNIPRDKRSDVEQNNDNLDIEFVDLENNPDPVDFIDIKFVPLNNIKDEDDEDIKINFVDLTKTERPDDDVDITFVDVSGTSDASSDNNVKKNNETISSDDIAMTFNETAADQEDAHKTVNGQISIYDLTFDDEESAAETGASLSDEHVRTDSDASPADEHVRTDSDASLADDQVHAKTDASLPDEHVHTETGTSLSDNQTRTETDSANQFHTKADISLSGTQGHKKTDTSLPDNQVHTEMYTDSESPGRQGSHPDIEPAEASGKTKKTKKGKKEDKYDFTSLMITAATVVIVCVIIFGIFPSSNVDLFNNVVVKQVSAADDDPIAPSSQYSITNDTDTIDAEAETRETESSETETETIKIEPTTEEIELNEKTSKLVYNDIITANSTRAVCGISNPVSNEYLESVRIYSATDNTVVYYQSTILTPGTELSEITLTQPVGKKAVPVILEFTFYDENLTVQGTQMVGAILTPKDQLEEAVKQKEETTTAKSKKSKEK